MIKLIHAVLWVILKSYRLQRYRIFTVLLAIIIGCAGFSSVLVINETAKRSYNDANLPLFADVHYAIYAKQGASISKADYANLRKSGHRNIVALSSMEVEAIDNSTLVFIGIDYYALMSLNNGHLNSNSSEDSIGWFSPNIKFMLHPEYAKQLIAKKVLSSDNYLTLNSQLSIGPISQIKTAGLNNQIVSDIETLFNQFDNKTISYLLVVGNYDDKRPPPIKLPTHLKLVKLKTAEDANQLTASFHLNLFAMGLLMFVVCMFVVLNALNLLMIKRVPMFKILRQQGVPVSAVFIASIIEMLGLAVICSAIGVILGIEISQWLSPAVNQTLESLYDVKVGFQTFSWFTLYLQVLLASIIGLSLAAALPLRLVNHQIGSISASTPRTNNENKWLAFSLISILISILVYFSDADIFGSFVIIALLIISGCFMVLFILPKLLSVVIRLIPHKMPTLRWSLADAKRVSNKSSIAFCAFFIAVAANVGMNLMVNSFRVATDSWITQRLNADGYIYTKNTDQVISLIKQNYPTVNPVIRQQETASYQGSPIQIRSYPSNVEHQKALLFERSLSAPWNTFIDGNGIFINQQFALSKQLKLGQKIEISRRDNSKLSMQVVAIYYDYGNPKPQAFISEDLIKDQLIGRHVIALFNQAPDQSWLAELKKRIAMQIPEAQIMETQEVLKTSMQTFDSTFVVTQSLNIITLLVAAFSLASSLSVIDFDNKPQRALIRSLGIPALRILILTLFQYTVLCLFICALAIPFGILLSWLLIHLINVQAFHWSYPLIIELKTIVQLVCSSLAVVLFVVVLPAAKAILKPPIEDIKWLNG
ncbi:ABC transporter permease [Alteromonas sp. M12]|uniref:ABC transporter permease n=1 Tax=Alteromonas sp. M12 TaxID=3135644 RepID=UPI00319E91C2